MNTTDPSKLTPEQVNAALNNWGKADLCWQAVAEIIVRTGLRDAIVPKYLAWSDDLTTARPDTRRYLQDVEDGVLRPASSTLLLARFCASLRGQDVSELRLNELWTLGDNGRRVVVQAITKALTPNR